MFVSDYKPILDGNKRESHPSASLIFRLSRLPLTWESRIQRETRFGPTGEARYPSSPYPRVVAPSYSGSGMPPTAEIALPPPGIAPSSLVDMAASLWREERGSVVGCERSVIDYLVYCLDICVDDIPTETDPIGGSRTQLCAICSTVSFTVFG